MVALPLFREPPAMPIFAVVFVSETRTKMGSDFGNDCETATVSVEPLTEILAVVGATAGCFVFGVGLAGGGGGGGGVAFFAVAVAEVGPTCCTNGSFVVKRSNEISWPVSACGPGSDSTRAAELTAAGTG